MDIGLKADKKGVYEFIYTEKITQYNVTTFEQDRSSRISSGKINLSAPGWYNFTSLIPAYEYGYYYFYFYLMNAVTKEEFYWGSYLIYPDTLCKYNDTTKPAITPVDDFTYEYGKDNNIINWNVSDINPGNYSIYENGVKILGDKWNIQIPDTIISVNVDNLSFGSNNITIVVTDMQGNSAYDTVFITVVDILKPFITNPLDITYEYGNKGNSITWSGSDQTPKNYIVYIDSIKQNESNWFNNTPIIIDVDGLNVGIYNYTIVIFDDFTNSISDTVLVTVIAKKEISSSQSTTSNVSSSTMPDTSSSTLLEDKDTTPGFLNGFYFTIIFFPIVLCAIIIRIKRVTTKRDN